MLSPCLYLSGRIWPAQSVLLHLPSLPRPAARHMYGQPAHQAGPPDLLLCPIHRQAGAHVTDSTSD